MEKQLIDEKKAIIEALNKALDKHCVNSRDVLNVILLLQEASDYLYEQRFKFTPDINFILRVMREDIKKHNLETFDSLCDTVSKSIILSGQAVEAVNLLSGDMGGDLTEVVALFSVQGKREESKAFDPDLQSWFDYEIQELAGFLHEHEGKRALIYGISKMNEILKGVENMSFDEAEEKIYNDYMRIRTGKN